MDSLFIYSLASMGGIAAILAAGLGIASRKFEVETDPKVDAVNEALPGANCGACGYAGCDGFAEAVVQGEAPAAGCPVGGEETAGAIADILDIEAESSEREVAQLLCQGGLEEAARSASYEGINSCRAASQINTLEKECIYGCIGYGDCREVCDFGAIKMNENGLPVVDEESCTACRECVNVCPHDLFILRPVSDKNHIRCMSNDPGKEVNKICQVGCIACQQCVKVCPVDAIEMEDDLAVLDYEKCINCGLCAEACPKDVIEFSGKKISEIEITENCIGCTRCAQECPVDAISGEAKEKHEIDDEKCVECGICYEVCPAEGAIVRELKGQ
ncbi:RnfABCDGE type electron transport complex subunit B [Halarsenatibacter silvermanii]|uniref:Ion-translocating oxidoreductase complex subunit B n=1 Tax=Halarsenatibacter silvermanii TaxID=321763 RepID=A0A1G9PB21_9FIRM|nr:RnfABCDGE type electron transport complex subunit B [Halarsenatibacter silvermanii]SDL95691.1 electron transport complex, RnfABCDGE type, B subunit [Halarsenatibacter silvermanii]